ncbi:toll-like receptor 13 isoform X1 [Anabas testudineus]|uniref:toll-like receptor 13 isoform X1 n=1 Tax=Anabas testudineus TaxID=64144 RepID=UPI000E45804C|nr:toll-like receptor 13 isoform X1 [Anabas testudineus]XP_026205515.1 toll-like receptor 13 isoform X1 [Anabas testudineus]
MPPGGRSSLCFILRLLVLLPFVLQPSLAYSLKNCTIDYSDDPLDDVFVDCSSRELVIVPDDLPRHVTSVKLFHNLLKKIHRKDFGSLSKLRSLNLQDNYITHVDDGSFIHLGALTTLDIRSNRLTNLTANLFQGLSNLTVLVLSTNHIKLIHTSAFQFLSSLQTVMLGFNNLQQITDIQPILQLAHLQELSISYNLFTSFETKDLQLSKSSGLKVLDVSYNKLKKFSITTPIFPHLQSIDLSRCGQAGVLKWDIPDKSLLRNITHLYLGNTLIPFGEIQQVLQSLDSLMHLRLDYMEKLIHKHLLAIVCKIPTLRKLDLFWNKVPNLSAKLVSCSQLSELDLSDTHMTELSKGSVRSMRRLRSLNVEHNLLTKVPDDVRSLSSLEILNLSYNLISELSCDDFINTTRLTELYLTSNFITELNRCIFENFDDLKVLYMSDNMIRTYGQVFNVGPPNLVSLDLSRNFVSCFDDGEFQGLRSLKYLDLVSNYIERIKHEAFDGLNNLETLVVSLPLDFRYNFRGLRHLENLTVHFSMGGSFQSPHADDYEAVFDVECLKVFTIICSDSHSDISLDVQILQAMKHLEAFTADNISVSAPDPITFQFNPQLKRLTITRTDLSDLDPELFHPIPNLEVLDFSNCYLKSLDFLAQVDLSALRYLKVTDNDLTVINETVFQSLPALTYLDLGNNPFTCDCSNAGFIQWVMSNAQTQVVNAHQYTCSFPVAQQGRKLLEFNTESCWMDVSFICFISSTCLVVLTLLSSFIYHFLRWQLAYGFYLFLAFLYDSRKKKKGTPHQFDAFVSYNVHDEAWVYREMLPVLEEEQGWRLCLHHRDFQPGKPIMENITDAIYGSRKTICVISRHYLQSEWCSREIQMASFRLFDEQKDVLILLFLEEIPTQQLSPYYRMRKLVKRRTYLSWPQAGQHTGVFWQNVRRALETGDGPTDNNLLTGPAQC